MDNYDFHSLDGHALSIDRTYAEDSSGISTYHPLRPAASREDA